MSDLIFAKNFSDTYLINMFKWLTSTNRDIERDEEAKRILEFAQNSLHMIKSSGQMLNKEKISHALVQKALLSIDLYKISLEIMNIEKGDEEEFFKEFEKQIDEMLQTVQNSLNAQKVVPENFIIIQNFFDAIMKKKIIQNKMIIDNNKAIY